MEHPSFESSAPAPFLFPVRRVGVGLSCALGIWGGPAAADVPMPVTEGGAESSEVLVQGHRPYHDAPTRAPTVAASVLRRDKLDRPGTTTAEVLREAPGVQVNQLGGLGAPATASVRGATAAQTPVYLGGVRVNDEVGGVANLADLPLFLIERVEVYRSHAPREVSDLGIGGALCFFPRRVHGPELQLRATVGSWGTRGLAVGAAVGNADRSVLAGFSLDASDNDYPFWSGNGTLYEPDDDAVMHLGNADARQRSAWLVARDQLGSASVELLYQHADREQGAPKLALTQSESARVEFWRELFALTTRVPIGSLKGELRATSSAVLATTSVDDPAQELGYMKTWLSTPGERAEETLELRHQLSRRFSLREQVSASIEGLRRYERDEGGSSELALHARRLSVRGAASAEYTLGRPLTASGHLGLRCFDTSQSTLSVCDDLAPSAQAGLSSSPGPFTFSLNAGYYHRLPTLTELFGQSLLVKGNPVLQLERGQTAELLIRYQLSRPGARTLLWAEASPFARFSQELIVYTKTAQGYLVPENRDYSRTLGVELSVGTEPLQGLELSANLSLLDPRDTSAARTTGNDVLPFLSMATAFARIEHAVRFAPVVLRSGAQFGWQSSRYADRAGLAVVPEQSTLDLILDVQVAPNGALPRLSSKSRLTNLLDLARYDVVGFPLPGRSFYTSLETTW